MSATDVLRNEHEGIKRMLRILESICASLEGSVAIPCDHLDGIVEFFRVFVDRCHHGKEEGFLFPALDEAGMGGTGGPIAVMLAEHEEGRGHVRAIADAVERCGKGEAGAGARIARNSRPYIDLLSRHIGKENNVLFPMADSVLSDETQTRLAAACENFETEKIGAGKHEEFHELMGRLEGVYLKRPSGTAR